MVGVASFFEGVKGERVGRTVCIVLVDELGVGGECGVDGESVCIGPDFLFMA